MAGESAGLEKFAALIFIKTDVGSKLLLALFLVITEYIKMFKINVMKKKQYGGQTLVFVTEILPQLQVSAHISCPQVVQNFVQNTCQL
jgi:hypothetical protein